LVLAWSSLCISWVRVVEQVMDGRPATSQEKGRPVKGTDVVNICNGHRGWAVAITKTHCKVRFWTRQAWCKEAEDADTSDWQFSRILPLEYVRPWTPQWDVKGGDASLHSSIACTGTQHLLHAKPARAARRLSPVRLRNGCGDSDLYRAPLLALPAGKAQGPREEREVVRSFCRTAEAVCGSIVAAWRLLLDRKRAGRIKFADLVRGGRAIGFLGNYRQLWRELTMNRQFHSHWISLGDIDPRAARLLEEFCDGFERHELTLEDLWEKHLKGEGDQRCSYREFMDAMEKLGFEGGKSHAFFELLDYGNQHDLSIDELELLGLRRRASVVQPTLNARERGQQQDILAKREAFEDFMGFLGRKFRNLVAAWRQGLDIDADGRLRFPEFCTACKRLGYRGKLKTLWRALDTNSVGFLTLGHLDKLAESGLEDFRSFIEDNFRTLEDAWERVFDTDKSGKCSESHFVASCRQLRYPGNTLRLFRWLDVNGRKDLYIDDLDILGVRRRGESRPTAEQKVRERQAKDRAEAEAMLGRFKVFLSQRFGNLVRAWRDLDPDGNGRLQFTDFCQACRQMGFQGNLKALWLSLDAADKGEICLDDLDPGAVTCLTDFTRLLRIFFDDLDSCWYSVLDPDLSERCSLEEFEKACKALGYVRDARQLHRYLDIHGSGVITVDELEVLGLPRSRSREQALARAKVQPTEARQELEQIMKEKFGRSVVQGWRMGFCIGPLDQQWTEEMNVEEFCNRCRALDFKGNLLTLWTEVHGAGLDQDLLQAHQLMLMGRKRGTRTITAERRIRPTTVVSDGTARPAASDGSSRTSTFQNSTFSMMRDGGATQVRLLGRISLVDFLPAVHKELLQFRKKAMAKFHTPEDLWAVLLQESLKSGDSRLRKVEFAQAARRAIGFTGSADVVFEACDIDQQSSISLQDFQFLQIGISFNKLLQT